MDSLRTFFLLWVAFTAAIVAYAVIDLGQNPWLHAETHFSMRPDFSQAPQLLHWGGRLLKEGATSLLVGNALVIGGLCALGARAILVRVARRAAEREPRPSLVPGSLSVPPPP